jgi:hypothetical protein
MQAIDADDGDGAIGGDVLPAVSRRSSDIGRPALCRINAPAWNRSERPVPALATAKLVPPPASANPAMVDGEKR